MKKTLLAVLVVFLLAFCAVSCQDGSSQETMEAESETEAESEIITDTYTRKGNTIYIGSYPQSKVTDKSITDELSTLAGALPAEGNSGAWTSYNYYIEGEICEYMWYIDVEYNGNSYRGVYFTKYRPYEPNAKEPFPRITSSPVYQYDNGYFTQTLYWFKYEPIAWTVVAEEDGVATLLCNTVLEGQSYLYPAHKSDDICDNNYAHSTVRTWLNDDFYSFAFNEIQKSAILSTVVDNSAASTASKDNYYACPNTSDQIFLPSYQELCAYSNQKINLDRVSSDYAKCQGVRIIKDQALWRLRSPDDEYSNIALCVVGSTFNSGYTTNTNSVGVVPSMRIKL
ncbi:MAG: hypothetical protein E7661_01180 [Ruminococcaceae bacterium]|nr:hypothetical protein [Oscillospiraceae bacterium]